MLQHTITGAAKTGRMSFKSRAMVLSVVLPWADGGASICRRRCCKERRRCFQSELTRCRQGLSLDFFEDGGAWCVQEDELSPRVVIFFSFFLCGKKR